MRGFTEYLTELAVKDVVAQSAEQMLDQKQATTSRLQSLGWHHNSGNFTHRDFPGHNLSFSAKNTTLQHLHASQPTGVYDSADKAHSAVANSED